MINSKAHARSLAHTNTYQSNKFINHVPTNINQLAAENDSFMSCLKGESNSKLQTIITKFRMKSERDRDQVTLLQELCHRTIRIY